MAPWEKRVLAEDVASLEAQTGLLLGSWSAVMESPHLSSRYFALSISLHILVGQVLKVSVQFWLEVDPLPSELVLRMDADDWSEPQRAGANQMDDESLKVKHCLELRI